MNGWGRAEAAARHTGESKGIFRSWLHQGIRHARLPSGYILFSFSAVDEFFELYCETQNKADRIVGEIVREVRG